jgi:hypothetical protein
MGEWIYRSTFSWPRHKLEVSGQLHAPVALPPGEKAPIIHWIRGLMSPWTCLDDMEKNSWTYRYSKSDPLVLQPVSSRYTDCVIPERNGIAVTLLIYIREVFGSNLGRNTSYSNWGFSSFSSVPQNRNWDSTSIRPPYIPSKSFLIHHSSIVVTIERLKAS